MALKMTHLRWNIVKACSISREPLERFPCTYLARIFLMSFLNNFELENFHEIEGLDGLESLIACE
jgi:hypothetical protein